MLQEGFVEKEDFIGLTEDKISKLWDLMGVNKIGLENRFKNTIKNVDKSEIHSIKTIVITPEEQQLLSNLKTSIQLNQTRLDSLQNSLKCTLSLYC